MKRCLLIILFFISQGTLSTAKNNESGRFGLGLILGSPTGISAKYWLDKSHALNAAIGFGDTFIHANYLWHRWDMIDQPQKGRLATYWGLGARLRDKSKDLEIGIRAVGGLSYDFARQPVDIFLEIVPVLELSPDLGIGVDIGLGARFFFINPS